MTRVGISDGRESVHRDIEKFARGVEMLVCGLIDVDYDGFGPPGDAGDAW